MQKVGRNDPCPCGSKKKHKHCCQGKKESVPVNEDAAIRRMIQAALEHHQAGRLTQAEEIYRKVLETRPQHPDVNHLLGGILRQRGSFPQAIALIKKAVDANPAEPVFQNSLGVTLFESGNADEAIVCYRKALSIHPAYPEAHCNLGNSLHALGKFEEAIASFKKALALRPDYGKAYNNLGNALHAQGNFEEAIANFRKALDITQDDPEVYCNLGASLQAQGHLEQAVQCLQKALSIRQGFPEALANLGNTFKLQGRMDEAIRCQEQALVIKPNFLKALLGLGTALMSQGNRLDEAIACYKKALAVEPAYMVALSNLLYLHSFVRDISPEEECQLAATWEKRYLSESERAAAQSKRTSFAISLPVLQTARKLKIGCVSAELGQHAVAEFLEPLLENFDRNKVDIQLYSTAMRFESRVERIRDFANGYKSFYGVSDKDASEIIRADQIDVLIDTTGHMSSCRLGIFALRSAPVQCHYIGCHGTTGLKEMDWFIADDELLPPSCNTHFRERIWRLPRLWISYRGDQSLPESAWTPSPDGTICLGTFNSLMKVREETCELWAHVMNAIPQSKLLLKDRKAQDKTVQNRITTELSRYGICGDRIEFIAWTPSWNDHMKLYDKVDIALDTIPLNSGTTAFDALWMGVPVVAIEGTWMGARLTSTILKALGRPEWIAKSKEEYVMLVASLANDLEGRIAARNKQRALMMESPLCDAKGLARTLESAFQQMLKQWYDEAVITRAMQSNS